MSLSPTGNNARMTGYASPAWSLLLVWLLLAGCTPVARHGHDAAASAHRHAAAGPATGPVQQTLALDLAGAPDLEGIIPRLAEKRVVFVGESHDRYDHHLTQLEIIRRLHAIHPRLAIGMEMFQQPFQEVLDDYVAGTLDEQELLRRSEYYQRWRFDFRLYAPILRYAREQQLPVVALNLPAELTQKAGRNGIDGLNAAERAQVPAEIDRSDVAYEQQLRQVFELHPGNGRSFDNFLDVQLLWDEGMAQQAADYLAAHPDYHMVILAGSGHIAGGSGIPRRLVRRLPVSSAIVLNGWNGRLEPGVADFILLPEPRTLPPSGKFGMLLEAQNPVPVVEACMPDSPCTRAGMKQGDRILSIDGKPIEDITEFRLAMWDKLPGDTVTVVVSRKHWFLPPEELVFNIELQ